MQPYKANLGISSGYPHCIIIFSFLRTLSCCEVKLTKITGHETVDVSSVFLCLIKGYCKSKTNLLHSALYNADGTNEKCHILTINIFNRRAQLAATLSHPLGIFYILKNKSNTNVNSCFQTQGLLILKKYI